jgi:regulator of protease activity HflC (stomatin/prohibitin superfamily)
MERRSGLVSVTNRGVEDGLASAVGREDVVDLLNEKKEEAEHEYESEDHETA